MSLKIENSRRVAKSRPVCMDLKTYLKYCQRVYITIDLTIIITKLEYICKAHDF